MAKKLSSWSLDVNSGENDGVRFRLQAKPVHFRSFRAESMKLNVEFVDSPESILAMKESLRIEAMGKIPVSLQESEVITSQALPGALFQIQQSGGEDHILLNAYLKLQEMQLTTQIRRP